MSDDKIDGINPLLILDKHKDFMRIIKSTPAGYNADANGFLNVCTGCVIFPVIESVKFFSSKTQYTGEIVASWNTSNDGGHAFRFNKENAVIFLDKVLGKE
jgi:hypothetical protein